MSREALVGRGSATVGMGAGGAVRAAGFRVAGAAALRRLADRYKALREHYFLEHEGDFPGGGRVARTPGCGRAFARVGGEARFWLRLLPLLPAIALGLSRREPDLTQRVKSSLGLGLARPAAQLDPTVLLPGSGPPPDPADLPPVQIIMPIFNAFELLQESLRRVVTHTDLPWRLILVEDRSTDPRVRPWLRDWVDKHEAAFPGRIELLENPRNLGFVAAVNRAFAKVRRGAGPVVLLNSDAMVPAGWASRLTAPLRDAGVATATPFTNDGEIFSVPIIATRSALDPGQGDRIDAALRARLASGAEHVEVPTGVGFCMAIGEDWLWRIGRFDPVFGRGYGEETDWCQRAAEAGGRHVAVATLFVEHRGGASFGDEKRARLRESGAVLSARYPGYDRAVRRFIRHDPLATARFVAALAWAETRADPGGLQITQERGAQPFAGASPHPERVALSVRVGECPGAVLTLSTPHGRAVVSAQTPQLAAQLLAPVAKIRPVPADDPMQVLQPMAEARAAAADGPRCPSPQHAAPREASPGGWRYARHNDRDEITRIGLNFEEKWQPVGESNPSFQVENLAS